MSQPFSQSQVPSCIQCGGTDYVLESGYYYCSECRVQSQDIREEVFEEFISGQYKGTRVHVSGLKPQQQEEQRTDDKGKDFTSWEALNVILHGLVNELILLGAPKELKVVTLQLWASYLRKIEAAFLSKTVEKKPRLGLTFRKRDAELVYSTNVVTIRDQKNPVCPRKRRYSSKKSDNLSESSSAQVRQATTSLRLTLKKKKLASAEYAASTSQSSAQSELTLDNLMDRSPSEKSMKSSKLCYTRNARDKLLDLLDNAELVDGEDREYLQKRVLKRYSSRSMEHPTIKKLLAILRIALLLLESDIHLGDLLRWSQEGYLSLLNAEKLIPPNRHLNRDVKLIFVTTLNSRETINKNVRKLAEFLGIHELKSRFLPLVERYLRELCLPSEMFGLISRLIGVKPPQLALTTTTCYEGRALAFIVFILKYLFGIDGTTEKCISSVASLVNKDINVSPKLFDWSAWIRFINCRSSVISYHHQGTRELHHPTSRFGGFKVFLSQWEKIPAKQTLQREHRIDRNLSECLRRFMKGISEEPIEPLPAPPLLPQSSLIKIIMETKPLPQRTRDILQYDFTKDTIQFLIETERQKEICDRHGMALSHCGAANYVIVKPLTGVSTGSKTNPILRRRQNVNVLIKDYLEENEDLNRALENQKIKFQNTKTISSNWDQFVEGKDLKKPEDGTGGSWSGVGRGYWVYHTSVTNKKVKSGAFVHLAELLFQPDFLWLLKVVSSVGNISIRELYRELTIVEKLYLEILVKEKGCFPT